MAKIKLVGKSGLVFISNDLAEKIIKAKTMHDASHIMDLGSFGMIELGQIKQIITDDQENKDDNELNEQKTRARELQMAEWNEYVDRCRKQGVEAKSERMVRSWCSLLWTARGNKPIMQLPKEVSDECMLRLIEFFDANQYEWHAPMKVYQDRIPYGTNFNKSTVKGFTTLAEQMQGKLI